MNIKDATPKQVAKHIGSCSTCLNDRIVLLRLNEQKTSMDKRDFSMSRYHGSQVDERVGELHEWFIPTP